MVLSQFNFVTHAHYTQIANHVTLSIAIYLVIKHNYMLLQFMTRKLFYLENTAQPISLLAADNGKQGNLRC